MIYSVPGKFSLKDVILNLSVALITKMKGRRRGNTTSSEQFQTLVGKSYRLSFTFLAWYRYFNKKWRS